MTGEQISVRVLTPTQEVYKGKASFVELPGADGCIGLGSGHAPLITTMSVGPLKVFGKSSGGDGQAEFERFASGGFCRIANNVLTIMTEVIESRSDIDQERARSAAERARKRLAIRDVHAAEQVSVDRATTSLARAEARIRFASQQ